MGGARGTVRRLAPLLVGVVLVVIPAAARAGKVQDVLHESDTNGDGKLQRSEAPLELLPYFQQIDENHDGAIDSFEAWDYDNRQSDSVGEPQVKPRAPAPKPAPKPGADHAPQSLLELVRSRDRDGSRRIAIRTLPEPLRDNLLDLDPDGDGYLDEDEARVLDERRERAAGAKGRKPASVVELVKQLDADGDGRLEKQEAPSALQPLFERLDLNGDGAIDLDEATRLDAARAKAVAEKASAEKASAAKATAEKP